MKVKERVFKIEDIDCEVTVEVVNRQKDIFDYLDEAIENTGVVASSIDYILNN